MNWGVFRLLGFLRIVVMNLGVLRWFGFLRIVVMSLVKNTSLKGK